MLRLVYETVTFGPLHLEYNESIVRAGSSRDNDLVLLHPSVQPYHCTLRFENDTVVIVPPEDSLDTGERYTAGDTLKIGEVPLLIQVSPNAVKAKKAASNLPPPGKTPEGYWRADAKLAPPTARWICQRCQIRLSDAQIKIIGLKGKKKHRHCPMCGRDVELLIRRDVPRTFSARLRATWKKWRKATLQFLFPDKEF